MLNSRRRFLKYGTILGCAPFFIPIASTEASPLSGAEEQFLEACANGDADAVERLLKEQKSLLAAKDQQGRSGLTLALLAGHRATAQLLKKSGYQSDLHESVLDLDWERFEHLIGEESIDTAARVNAQHPMGGCAMWAAAAGGAGADIWRVYAKCGDPNCIDEDKSATTPLQKALRFPDLPVAEMTAAALLSNQADPNKSMAGDRPPLHIAAERGSLDLVEMLIRLGADVRRRDKNGRSALNLAEQEGRQDAWKLLSNHQGIPRTCRTSRTAFDATGQPYLPPDVDDIPLFLRSRLVGRSHGSLEYVQQEVKADTRLAHSVATTGEICIEACAHTGQKEIVEFLLDHGAPYSLPTAVMLGDFETVKRLLDEDPDRIHERGAHDFALLWYPVIGRCDLEMMQLLLNRGAAIEQQHYLGTTALHWACMRGPIELVELLLDNGANINRIGRKFSSKGQSPLDLTKDEKIAGLLRSRGAR